MPQFLPVKPFSFELILILKNVPKDELAFIVKRAARCIFKHGGFLRDLRYMGLQNTPYRLSKNNTVHWQANYFYGEFHLPKAQLTTLFDEYMRDVDIVKHQFIPRNKENINYEQCTFEDEMKPVPYRPQVIKLVEIAKKFAERKTRRRVKLNMSTDFYPFQK